MLPSFSSMEAHNPGDARCNGGVVPDHGEITFAQGLAALVWRICGLGDPKPRREPDETATGAEKPPDGTARVPELLASVGQTADSEQPRHGVATGSEPPPDATTTVATEAADGTGGPGGATEDEDRLPEDYQNILDRLVAPVKYSSREELDSIFRKNLLIDNSSASFTLGSCGKKSYMFSSRDFDICWIQERQYWRRMRFADSRFPEVVLLVAVCWFTLYCKFNMKDLSEHTTYSVLLVYECTDDLRGLEDTQNCSVSVGDRESRRRVSLGSVDEEEDKGRRVMAMAPMGGPRTRRDGWTEVEVGELPVEKPRDQIVEVRVEQTQRLNWKRGIIIEGIELRAKGTLEL